jgi:DNA invertase Pin-like site-specific DNA recombinase
MGNVQTIGAVYGRHSSDLQNERSSDHQVAALRARAARDGVVIPDENVFLDRAVSGTQPDRNGLQQLKEAAKAKRFVVLYLEDLSRLGRDLILVLLVLRELKHGGIRVISVNEGPDSNSPTFDLLATVLGLQHERYLSDLADRIRRGKRGALDENLSVGDHCLGYRTEAIPGSAQTR